MDSKRRCLNYDVVLHDKLEFLLPNDEVCEAYVCTVPRACAFEARPWSAFPSRSRPGRQRGHNGKFITYKTFVLSFPLRHCLVFYVLLAWRSFDTLRSDRQRTVELISSNFEVGGAAR